MFTNVIIGIDGREGGRDALTLARRLAAPDARLTLVHVYIGDELPWRGTNREYDAVAAQDAMELLASAAEQAGTDAARRAIGCSSVGRGLHHAAEAARADLLVVGSSRRGLFGRVLVGDDTRAALNGAPCAIAVAPAGYAESTAVIREIGVGFNGSAESLHALGVARVVAAEHHAKLSAFEAVALPAYTVMAGASGGLDPLEGLVDAARERIAALGGVEPHAAYGRPSEELAVFSASIDLLVLGSRDYGPLGRLVHGSTSSQLTRTARCPLLVLTRAARRADAATNSGRTTEPAHA